MLSGRRDSLVLDIYRVDALTTRVDTVGRRPEGQLIRGFDNWIPIVVATPSLNLTVDGVYLPTKFELCSSYHFRDISV